MKLTEFKKQFDDSYERMERFNEIDRTDVIIIESNGVPLVLFMRDQELLEHIKVEK